MSVQRRLFASALATALGISVAGGCSSNRPPVSGDEGFPAQDAAVGFTSGDASVQCSSSELDGGPCGCLEISLISDQPNLYFVLDRSGSMLEDNKLTTVRQVVSDVVQKIGPRAKFGVAIFADTSSGDGCNAGREVMPLRVGDSPAGTAGVTTNEVIDTTNVAAQGGTPTAATFLALAPLIEGLPGNTFVILATDGAPNCNEAASCDVSQCSYNIDNDPGCPTGGSPNCCDPVQMNTAGVQQGCVDTAPTVAAVAALKAKNVPTYVMGLPGSEAYASVLDQLATAGGTARPSEPLYYDVTTADPTAVEGALSQIAAKITASCVFPLTPPPQDPDLVNVYFDNVVVPKDANNGWTMNGSTLTLVGTSCAEILSGKVLNLRVIAGCPTVIPR